MELAMGKIGLSGLILCMALEVGIHSGVYILQARAHNYHNTAGRLYQARDNRGATAVKLEAMDITSNANMMLSVAEYGPVGLARKLF